MSLYCTYKTILQNTYRVPDRFDAPESNGIPTKQASNPSAVLWIGSRIMEAIPPERGISFGLVGKLKFLFKRLQTENWRVCKDVLSLFRLSGFEPTTKRNTILALSMFWTTITLAALCKNKGCPGEGLEATDFAPAREKCWGGVGHEFFFFRLLQEPQRGYSGITGGRCEWG